MAKKELKTNVMRVLDSKKLAYNHYTYDNSTVNGVEAAPETVLSKEYPIARPLYMYTNGRPKAGTPLADFIGLAASSEGRQIIEDTGFVPLP